MIVLKNESTLSHDLRKEDNAKITYGFPFRNQQEIDKRNKILQKFDPLARSLGSELIELPIIAPISNFLGDAPRPLSEKNKHRLFSDTTSDGSPLSVRYEGTSLTAKYVASEIEAFDIYNKKYHYFQEMVRIESQAELDDRHSRAFYQGGLEAFTDNYEHHLKNIAGVIEFIDSFTSSLDLPITIRFSHTEIISSIFSKMNIDKFAQRRIISLLEKSNFHEISRSLDICEVPKEQKEIILELVSSREIELRTGISQLKKYPEYFHKSVYELETVFNYLSANKNLDLRFDAGIYRSLDFYSGITIQGDIPEMKECLGGGDFTGLVENYGINKKVFSFGMALGIERLMRMIKE